MINPANRPRGPMASTRATSISDGWHNDKLPNRGSGLRTAWRGGEVRPTSKPKTKARRSRRRPDPSVLVTAQVREWFEAEPWRTSRELLERLQAEQPGVFPDGQLRTLRRRLKEWRCALAHKMMFGAEATGTTAGPAAAA
jgi:hypothetical protein